MPLPPSRIPQQREDLSADISCSKTEGGSVDVEAYDRKEGHNEGEHVEKSRLLLLLLVSIMMSYGTAFDLLRRVSNVVCSQGPMGKTGLQEVEHKTAESEWEQEKEKTEQTRGSNQSTVQMSKRQAKRKRGQLQQNQARKARWAQLADAAAEKGG